MSFSNQTIDFEALLYALDRQTEPLPTDLQHSLTEIGRSLHENRPDSARQLRELIQQYLPLEIEYKNALAQSDARYATQQRTKSLGTSFSPILGLDDLLISRVLATNDWVTTAKQLTYNLIDPQTPAQFWDKTDRIVVMTGGGMAIGGAIAQLPGAIIGGILAAGYGWYIGFGQAKQSHNS
jgi:hypothetical protein